MKKPSLSIIFAGLLLNITTVPNSAHGNNGFVAEDSFADLCPCNHMMNQLIIRVAVLCAITIGFFINLFTLLISYAIIQKFRLVKSWRFVRYLVLVIIGGFIINAIAIWVAKGGFVFSILLAGLLLFVYNFALCKKFFGLSEKKATVIGCLMGIFTSPYLYLYAWGSSCLLY